MGIYNSPNQERQDFTLKNKFSRNKLPDVKIKPEVYLMGRVEGRVAIVTGAAQGLGASYARALAAEGASVAIAR